MTGARVVAVALIASVAAWAGIAAAAIHASLPLNPIELSPERELVLRELLPEGWKFFTRNPQEAQILPFALTDGAWTSASLTPNARPVNLFGLDRAGRSQGIELGTLLEQLDAGAWAECEGSPLTCLGNVPVTASLKNPFPRPSLCGELGFVSQKPVPWAWARLGEHVEMPARVVRVVVQC
jgi:antimicrobial peptide system SdpA family protein